MTRTWQDNALEFGNISKGVGGWSLAVLVACSVELGANDGRPSKSEERSSLSRKVSAREFARQAGVDSVTVLNYRNGWDQAIWKGAIVPPANDLSPDDVGTFALPARPFNGPGGYISTRKVGNGSADDQVENIVRGSKLTGTIAESSEAMHALVESAPPEVISKIASHPKVQVESVRQRIQHRPIVDPAPVEKPAHGLGDGIALILATDEALQAIDRIVELVRRGLFDFLPDDVKQEAVNNYRRMKQALDFAEAIAGGQSITDDALSEWLAS